MLDGEATSIDCSQEAEDRWDQKIQDGLQKTVWKDGNCDNWYSRDAQGKQARNASTYPFTQGHFWYKCVFPDYEDLAYTVNFFPPTFRGRSFDLVLTRVHSPPSTAGQRSSAATSRLPLLHLRSSRLSRRHAPSGRTASRVSSKATPSRLSSSFTCFACASDKPSAPNRNVDACQESPQFIRRGLRWNVNHVIFDSADLYPNSFTVNSPLF